MTTKADDLATEIINFPYLVSPSSVPSNLGYANKRPRITKTGGITASTTIGNLTIGIKGVYSVTLNIQARLTSITVPQMYWTNPSIGSIGFGSVLGDNISIKYCSLTTSFNINVTSIYTLPIVIIIPASQTGLLNQLILDYEYIRIG